MAALKKHYARRLNLLSSILEYNLSTDELALYVIIKCLANDSNNSSIEELTSFKVNKINKILKSLESKKLISIKQNEGKKDIKVIDILDDYDFCGGDIWCKRNERA